MKVLREGLESWLAMREIETLDSLRGRMSQRNVMDPTAFERANYIKILQGLR
jgi:dihydroorotate dehydrogenase (fumarate)